MIYIVTRHAGAIAWLRAKGFDGEVVAHLTGNRIKPDNIYIGVLPVPVIQQILEVGSRFWLLVLPEVTLAQRDREMTPAEMDAAGARLVEVKRIETVPVEMTG
jgi:putative CRISPR-associated protein (TIGR02620 family)